MVNHGIQFGSVRPKEIEITDTSVFIASDIISYTKVIDNYSYEGYKYLYTQYNKNEYIEKLARENANLQKELTETQLALCDIYESLQGGE